MLQAVFFPLAFGVDFFLLLSLLCGLIRLHTDWLFQVSIDLLSR